MKEVVLIPQKRINILKSKETRERIEKELNVKITIQENTVNIDGEGLNLYQAKNIVKAIARGFPPEKAFRLLNENEQIEIIELKDFSDKKMKTVKSRLIGTQGKTRKMIEKFSGCAISIYGKTVSIIGEHEQIEKAKQAVEMIINGAKHTNVYKYLNRVKE